MIVMLDADMDKAVNALMRAAYGLAGERCMAISVAVPIGGETTAERLIQKLARKVRALIIGPGTSLRRDGAVGEQKASRQVSCLYQRRRGRVG